METIQNDGSEKDLKTIVIILAIGLLVVLLVSDVLPFIMKVALVISICTSFLVGHAGSKRKIGYTKAFIVSLVFSPIIGFIVVFNSEKLVDEAYRDKMLELAGNKAQPETNVADQLHKLNELRKEGVLTDEEFQLQKEKLLAS